MTTFRFSNNNVGDTFFDYDLNKAFIFYSNSDWNLFHDRFSTIILTKGIRRLNIEFHSFDKKTPFLYNCKFLLIEKSVFCWKR